ncbi:ankyrin [Nemania abortiva]|nr:ankyrin [Nemania abortiva]
MEPLSNIASIFAVISLALQLAQSAFDVKRFLDTIENAPAEVARLKGVVTQLHLIAHSTTTLLEHQKRLRKQESQVSNSIYDSLKMCQGKLDLIQDVLQIAKKVNHGQSSVSRNWAQIRLACKKEKIDEFERQLEQAISVLNTNLLLNLIQSNFVIESNIGSLAQQITNYRHTKLSGFDLACNSSRRELNSGPSSFISKRATQSRPSILKAWTKDNSFDLLYYELSGRNKKNSLLFRLNIYNTYIFTMHISRILGTILSLPFNISIRNLIPTNAAILSACGRGDSEQVKRLLISRAARPNDMTLDNKTPLGVAIKSGFEEIVQLLLHEGADPNLPCGRFEMSPLQHAVALGKLDIVRILVQRGADPTYNSAGGWSLYHYMFENEKPAAHTEYFSIFRDLLMFDDVQDSLGWTALHRCAAFGTEQDIYSLYQVGASAWSAQYITNWGGTPMHVAATRNNVSTMNALFNLCDDRLDVIESVDNQGWTPLHIAVYCKAEDAMKWLLNKGADPHRITYCSGWSPSGYEGKTFNAADLATISGAACREAFIGILRDIGHDITIAEDDIYWESG